MKKLSKEEMIMIKGGLMEIGKKCTGSCWTGDNASTSYACGKFLSLDCTCNINAVGGNCKMV